VSLVVPQPGAAANHQLKALASAIGELARIMAKAFPDQGIVMQKVIADFETTLARALSVVEAAGGVAAITALTAERDAERARANELEAALKAAIEKLNAFAPAPAARPVEQPVGRPAERPTIRVN
jgi:hypothetical protein